MMKVDQFIPRRRTASEGRQDTPPSGLTLNPPASRTLYSTTHHGAADLFTPNGAPRQSFALLQRPLHFLFGFQRVEDRESGQPPDKDAVYTFGASGFRTRNPEEFKAGVRKITTALADWGTHHVNEHDDFGALSPAFLVGGDNRPLSQQAVDTVSRMLQQRGFDVYQASEVVTTPMLSLAAKKFDEFNLPHPKVLGAVVITASHNPYSDHGINFLTHEGALAPETLTDQFEAFQREPLGKRLRREGSVQRIDLFPAYQRQIKENLILDLDRIRGSKINVVYDAMYGAGGKVMPRLLTAMNIPHQTLRADSAPPAGFKGHPEPNKYQLAVLADEVRRRNLNGVPTIGLATDGDADRIATINEAGEWVPPNDIMKVLLRHYIVHKGVRSGAVARSDVTSHSLDEVAQKYGLRVIQTPTGFKHLGRVILNHETTHNKPPILLAGESSGGIAPYRHLPEKDGIAAGMMLLDAIAHEPSRSLKDLTTHINASLSRPYIFQEYSLATDKGPQLVDHFKQLVQQDHDFADLAIDKETTLKANKRLESFGNPRGYKVYFEDGTWLFARISGTEPVARIFYEASNQAATTQLTTAIHTLLTGKFQLPEEKISKKY
jgi:phosphomannomutase